MPQIIVSDNHKAFQSKLFIKFCEDLGIRRKNSAARNPTGNWVERAHKDFKRKTNSLLRQKEQNSNSTFFCDLCEQSFPTYSSLRKHLDNHGNEPLTEAIMAPGKQALFLIKKELSSKHHKNWIATLPAVLWAMRTEFSSTRGASPYQIIFGKSPTTSLDLLYGQPVKPQQFSSSADFMRARTRKFELCEAYVKQNLAKQLIRQRQYYSAIARVFGKGDWVYLFTPVKTEGVSEKIDSYWSGPWQVAEKLAATTYRVEPIPGYFVGSFKPQVVQVDRIKIYHPKDPVVAPPLSFTGEVSDADPNIENYIVEPTPPPHHIQQALKKAHDPVENGNGILDAIPPWQSHLKDNIVLPDQDGKWQTPTSPEKPETPFVAKPRKNKSPKFTGLPAPLLTRSKAKLNNQAINSIESTFCSIDEQLASDYENDLHLLPQQVQIDQTEGDSQWDHFMYHRCDNFLKGDEIKFACFAFISLLTGSLTWIIKTLHTTVTLNGPISKVLHIISDLYK